MIKAKYKLYPEQELLVEIFYGDIALTDLQLIITEQMKNPDFVTIKKTLSDVRQANMLINSAELDNYFDNLIAYLEDMQLTWGILTETPKETAMSLFVKTDDYFPKKIEVFSTLSSLILFLRVNISDKDLSGKDYLPIRS